MIVAVYQLRSRRFFHIFYLEELSTTFFTNSKDFPDNTSIPAWLPIIFSPKINRRIHSSKIILKVVSGSCLHAQVLQQ